MDSGACTISGSADNLLISSDKSHNLPAGSAPTKTTGPAAGNRDVSKFVLKRSQSAVTFSSVVRDEMKSKPVTTSNRFPGGSILKHFIQVCLRGVTLGEESISGRKF